MSIARECDRCGALFKPIRGCLTIGELHVTTGVDERKATIHSESWSELDFCPGCSKIVREAIGEAIIEEERQEPAT